MYLVPYLLIALAYAGSLVVCLRFCGTYGFKSLKGKITRGVTSLLLFFLLYVIWKYVTIETFEAKKWSDEKLVFWIRTVSLLLFAGANIEVWLGIKVKEKQ